MTHRDPPMSGSPASDGASPEPGPGADPAEEPARRHAATRNPPWVRDEEILLLDVYLNDDPRSASDPAVIELSRVLRLLPIHPPEARTGTFRNPTGVMMKLATVAHVDPANRSRGLARVNRLTYEVWDEFASAPGRLRSVAAAIRSAATDDTLRDPLNRPAAGESGVPEGRILFRLHRLRERSRRLVRARKAAVLADEGKLACEVCGFDFSARYGELGAGFAECHHRTPLSELSPGTPVRPEDLAVVCANCHRMLHRGGKSRALAEVREALQAAAPGSGTAPGGGSVAEAGATRKPKPIYLDHHATTPTDPRVADAIRHALLDAFGNPNSVDHPYGEEAAALVVSAAEEVGALLGAAPDRVLFTAGASEAIRVALRHELALRGRAAAPVGVAASAVEHPALLGALDELASSGEIRLHPLPVDEQARLDEDALRGALAAGVGLVCVMAANNEVGTIYPTQRIAEVSAAAGARVLVDATQAAGRVPLDVDAWGIAYLAVSAHKLYGPKGVGALVLGRGLGAPPRPHGTPAVPLIAGFGEACRLRRLEGIEDEQRMARLRDRLQELLVHSIPGLAVNGDLHHRLGHNLHVSVPGVPNDAVIARTRGRIAISTGAACASGALTASHVLRAMGLPEELQDGALRIGLGRSTTPEEVETAAQVLAGAVAAVRAALSDR